MDTFISNSPAQTEAWGQTWGRAAASGLVLGLCGDLGTGKTQFVKGLARGLGSPARVQSPTFALVNIYQGGRLTLFHLDLYRLDQPEQMVQAGLEPYLEPEGITVIEWADKWFGPWEPSLPRRDEPMVQATEETLSGAEAVRRPVVRRPRKFHWLRFEALGENSRSIQYEPIGS
jgi:tRNA threonylcarbamoyladenosine biosynthesis protein TsaE